MVLEIFTAGAPVLKSKTQAVGFVGRNEKKLLNDMADTMYAADGVGLAAPQVGASLQIIVVDDGDGLIELINPVIIERVGSAVAEEGCLSCPGYTGEVERAQNIIVEGLDRNMRKLRIECVGLLARIFQHEIDHLDGVLFTERARTLKAEPVEE